jgi:tRNA pseudouridine synthase 10
MEITEGSEHVFHGMGREDIDARMLGNGRPFIIEIKNPKRRKIDYDVLKTEINAYAVGKVQVDNLEHAEKIDVVKLKESKYSKTYRVVVESTTTIEKEKLKKVCNIFRNAEIMQYTPLRVLHRRADLCRKRKILEMNLKDIGACTYEFTITAQAGTYIKEFITGDKGRTMPNLADSLETVLNVKELDVIYIHDSDKKW